MNKIICSIGQFDIQKALPEEGRKFKYDNHYFIAYMPYRKGEITSKYIHRDGTLNLGCSKNGWFKTFSGALRALAKYHSKNNVNP